MKTIGLIFSAGKEKRFESKQPKSLSLVNGKCVLDENIKKLRPYCDDVVVVVNKDNKNYFTFYNHIVINSGFGCGDAVLRALIQKSEYDMVVILWGDCLVNDTIIASSIEAFCDQIDVVVPCTYEKNPYVWLKSKNNRINVGFSKYHENVTYGYHDYGFFYGKRKPIFLALRELCSMHKCEHGYTHEHGNEIQFLDIFNETSIVGKLVPIQNIPTKSFNTIDELKSL